MEIYLQYWITIILAIKVNMDYIRETHTIIKKVVVLKKLLINR